SQVLLLSLAASLFSFPVIPVEAATGINRTIHYQGKVSLVNSAAVSNGSYNMRFKIFDAQTSGTQLWAETWSSSTQQVTMTGGLTLQNTGVGLNALGAISGATLFSSLKLATSGSLTVNGAVKFKNYTSCGLIATDSSGNLSCQAGALSTSTGSLKTYFDRQYV